MTKAFEKITTGIAGAADWAAGIGTAVVYMDGQRRQMTKAEYDLYMSGRKAGAKAERERCAKVAEAASTFEWRGGEEWAAGYVDGKNAAAAAIRAQGE